MCAESDNLHLGPNGADLGAEDEVHNPLRYVAPYATAVDRFSQLPFVCVAAGATCAYLGDERNLREFLVADETVRQLRITGQTVMFMLVDDSMDPLSLRQLRVAVQKDETLVEQFESWCGRPIGHLPDPWGCHASFAAHFESALIHRLRALDANPTIVSTASLYGRGVYRPYVQTVLERADEIRSYLKHNFKGYEPERLFWPLCEGCGHIDSCTVERVGKKSVRYYCCRCEQSFNAPLDGIQGKLNWKLDCAARWVILNVHAEPFTKAYLEPQSGSFPVAQGISTRFFGGHDVLPLPYGQVHLEKRWSYKLLETLPPLVLRGLLTEKPTADVRITQDLLLTTASRRDVEPGMKFLDFVKQILPLWMLTPGQLKPHQRQLVSYGIAFSRDVLGQECGLRFPGRDQIVSIPPLALRELVNFLNDVLCWREGELLASEDFLRSVHARIVQLGSDRAVVLRHLRALVGQSQGLPAPRFLEMLPLAYLQMLHYVLELTLHSIAPNTETLTLVAQAPVPI